MQTITFDITPEHIAESKRRLALPDADLACDCPSGVGLANKYGVRATLDQTGSIYFLDRRWGAASTELMQVVTAFDNYILHGDDGDIDIDRLADAPFPPGVYTVVVGTSQT